MRRARWLAHWRFSRSKPVLYHCISRVVDRRLLFGSQEKEKFRSLMRAYEHFSGCRVLSYCLLGNHFHLLLEVPPAPEEGISDAQLIERLAALYPASVVAEVSARLAEARRRLAEGSGTQEIIDEIHRRYTYRMHDLGEFMKGLLQRFTQWFNARHRRKGHLWEDRFKSLIVEDGTAARAIAAYIDLNPVRAGVVGDPADYRWCSYGEAVAGHPKGGAAIARAGLVRGWGAHLDLPADATLWPGKVAKAYRRLLLAQGTRQTRTCSETDGRQVEGVARRGIDPQRARAELDTMEAEMDVDAQSQSHTPSTDGSADDGAILSVASSSGSPSIAELPPSGMMCRRIRYFTDGVVIGSRCFVEDLFARHRWRFGQHRQTGARRMNGAASPAHPVLWSLRDLKKGIG